MQPQSPRPHPGTPVPAWPAAASAADPPSLATILAHYRRHGTLAGELARQEPPPAVPAERAVPTVSPGVPSAVSPNPPAAASAFAEPIHGLHTRELDGAELFEHFFGRPR